MPPRWSQPTRMPMPAMRRPWLRPMHYTDTHRGAPCRAPTLHHHARSDSSTILHRLPEPGELRSSTRPDRRIDRSARWLGDEHAPPDAANGDNPHPSRWRRIPQPAGVLGQLRHQDRRARLVHAWRRVRRRRQFGRGRFRRRYSLSRDRFGRSAIDPDRASGPGLFSGSPCRSRVCLQTPQMGSSAARRQRVARRQTAFSATSCTRCLPRRRQDPPGRCWRSRCGGCLVNVLPPYAKPGDGWLRRGKGICCFRERFRFFCGGCGLFRDCRGNGGDAHKQCDFCRGLAFCCHCTPPPHGSMGSLRAGKMPFHTAVSANPAVKGSLPAVFGSLRTCTDPMRAVGDRMLAVGRSFPACTTRSLWEPVGCVQALIAILQSKPRWVHAWIRCRQTSRQCLQAFVFLARSTVAFLRERKPLPRNLRPCGSASFRCLQQSLAIFGDCEIGTGRCSGNSHGNLHRPLLPTEKPWSVPCCSVAT